MSYQPVLHSVPLAFPEFPWSNRQRAVLTSDECDELVEWAQRTGRYRKASSQLDCKVEICELRPRDLSWPFERFANAFVHANVWRLSLSGITHPLRILRYHRGGYSGRHSDLDYKTADHSKITAIVPLVSRSSWSGGRLIVSSDATPRCEKGDAVFFPSFAMHEVTKVTRGTRTVLAAWVSGPPLS